MSSHAAHTARIGGLLADPPAGPIARLLVILRSDPRAMTVAFLGTIVASLAALVQPALTGSLVGALQSLDMQRLMLIGSLLVGAAILSSVITAGVNLVTAYAGNRLVRSFRDESADIALRVPRSWSIIRPPILSPGARLTQRRWARSSPAARSRPWAAWCWWSAR